jgi:hypothetical protein
MLRNLREQFESFITVCVGEATETIAECQIARGGLRIASEPAKTALARPNYATDQVVGPRPGDLPRPGPSSMLNLNSRTSCPSMYTRIACAPIGSPGA